VSNLRMFVTNRLFLIMRSMSISLLNLSWATSKCQSSFRSDLKHLESRPTSQTLIEVSLGGLIFSRLFKYDAASLRRVCSERRSRSLFEAD
ncbi:MAG: hypothetical protein ACK55Z_20130, partial [bacterium]